MGSTPSGKIILHVMSLWRSRSGTWARLLATQHGGWHVCHLYHVRGALKMGRWAKWWWRSQPSRTDWALICPCVTERSLSILPTDSLLWSWLGGSGRQEGELAGWPADLLAPAGGGWTGCSAPV